jgi:hypothetical protein
LKWDMTWQNWRTESTESIRSLVRCSQFQN